MAGSEGVVDVEIGEFAQLGREAGVVLLFAGVEAQVLEEEKAAFGDRVRLGDDVGAGAVLAPCDFGLRQLRELLAHRRERVLRFALPFRAAEVRGDHDERSGVAKESQRRERLLDARRVGDARAVERDVVVDAIEDTRAARNRDVGQRTNMNHDSNQNDECRMKNEEDQTDRRFDSSFFIRHSSFNLFTRVAARLSSPWRYRQSDRESGSSIPTRCRTTTGSCACTGRRSG